MITAALTLLLVFGFSTAAHAAEWADVVPTVERSVLRLHLGDDNGNEGTCSAIVINAEKGYLLTAAHCVTTDDHIVVGKDRTATLVISNRLLDLAVLKTKLRKEATAIVLAPTSPRLGAPVGVLGFPFGARSLTLQVGVVANPDVDDRMWVDGNLLPGDSGGAIINNAGHLVGVTSAFKYFAAAHIGVAVPLDTLRAFVADYLP